MKKILSSFLISFVLSANLLIPFSVFAATPTIKFELREDKENKETLKRSWELTLITTGIEVGKAVSIGIFSETEELQAATYKTVKIETGGVGYYSTGYILDPATKYKITATYPGIKALFEKITLGTAPAEASPNQKWWFTNEAKQVIGSNGIHGFPGFDTRPICDKARIPYKSTTTSSVSDCFPSTDAEINNLIKQEQAASEKFTREVINKEEPISVTPKIGATENNNIYKMLVPLPGITCMDNTGKDPNCIGNNIGKYLNFIFKFGIGLCAALAVVMLIIYGIVYMGDESIFAKTEAKKKMFGAIIGLIIAIGGWALLNTINPDLTGKNGLTIDPVNVKIENSAQYRLAQTQDTPEAKIFKKTSYYNQIKSIALNNNIPSCLMQVAIQRESGGNPSIGHDEDVPYASVASRRDFIASGKKFDGTIFTPGDKNDSKITQRDFLNTDHPSKYTQAPNLNINNLGLDWRFSHSVGMFGVTFGPNHLNPDGAKAIYTDSNADITKATNMMKNFYSQCNNNIEGTWRAYNSGSCNGNNDFTNKETAIRLDLYNQCLAQDK